MNGLMILCDFDIKQVTKRRSEDLRNEFSWLNNLKWQTIKAYRNADEVEEAGRHLVEPPHPNARKTAKRRMDNNGLAAKKKRKRKTNVVR